MVNRLPTDEHELRETYEALNSTIGRGLSLIAAGLCAFAIASRLPDVSLGWVAGRLAVIAGGLWACALGTGVIWVAKERERSLKRLGLAETPPDN